MRAARCEVCREVVHLVDSVEYGWFGQYGDGQVVVHRGECERTYERRMLDPQLRHALRELRVSAAAIDGTVRGVPGSRRRRH